MQDFIDKFKKLDTATKIVIYAILGIIVALIVVKIVIAKKNDTSLEGMSKAEVISVANEYKTKYEDSILEISDLNNTLNQLKKYSSHTSISDTIYNDDTMNFNSYDSKIVFPKTFIYPNSEELSDTTRIQLTSNVTMGCDTNWIVRLTGSGCELQHSNGINGTIKLASIDKIYDVSKLKSEVLETWMKENTSSNVIYSNIFLSNKDWGVQAQAQISVDEKPVYMRVGMFGFGNVSVIYIFTYDGEKDNVKDESIKTLLNSIEFLGQDLTVE